MLGIVLILFSIQIALVLGLKDIAKAIRERK